MARTHKDQKVYATSLKKLKGLFKRNPLSKTHTMKVKRRSKRKTPFGNYTYTVDFIPK